ncbi:hypothetical protein ACFY64_12010 [Streptomyces collinus]|uniref:hypothetical protein n=1 Tax=Streptomyces collinus TaxID=42684 RepID=UPI0036C9A131
MDAEDLDTTPAMGPSCTGVRDLIVELLAAHPLVSRVGEIREYRGDAGLRVEMGGLSANSVYSRAFRSSRTWTSRVFSRFPYAFSADASAMPSCSAR